MTPSKGQAAPVNGSATDFRFVLGRGNVGANTAYELQSLDGMIEKAMGAAGVPSLFSITPRTGGKSESDNPLVDNWTVFASLRALARGVAGVRLVLWESEDPKAKEVSAEHPLYKLLKRPSRRTSWAQSAAAAIVHRRLTGEDFWFLMDANGQPIVKPPAGWDGQTDIGDQPLDYPTTILNVAGGKTVMDTRDQFGRVQAWQYTGASGNSPMFPACSVLHFYDYDPADPERGIGAVAVADRQIKAAFQAERYLDSTLRGGGPGAYAIRETPIDPAENARQQAELDAKTRDAESARQTKILQGKWTIVPNPATAKDIGAFEQLKWARDVVAATLEVPLPVINVFENATYNNLQEAWRQFFIGIADYLTGVADVLNTQFIPRLKDKSAARFRVGFATDEIESLKTDNTERYKAAVEMSKPGSNVSFEEACEILGLDIPPTKHGKSIWVPGNLIPIEAALASEEPTSDANGVPLPTQDAPALPGAADVQTFAMNGAQTESLLSILAQISEGRLTADGGIAVLMVAFPTITEEQAARIVAGALPAEPEPDPTPPVEPDPAKTYTPEERAALFAKLTPLGKEARAEFARSYEARVLRRGDRKVYTKVKRWLTEYERATLARWRAFAKPAKGKAAASATKSTGHEIELLLVERRNRWEQLLREYAGPAIDEVYELSLADTANDYGGISIPMTDPRVVESLASQKLALSEGVTSTVSERVKAAVIRVLGEPASIADLQIAVRNNLPALTDELARVFGTKEARALTIARTESGHASSSARFLQLGEMGVKRLQWVTAHDDAVRESHKEVDGDVASYGTQFRNGLAYPRDTNGPADEVINCRCTFIGLFDEDET